ncbi:MAG: winged helix-turn-helix domain-containing protein [Candidatus Competibacteraceae bacterium]
MPKVYFWYWDHPLGFCTFLCQTRLRDYIEYHYGVVYHSKQSYYDLLHEARLSWHKTKAANPNRDEVQVLQKREK